jgi:small redox-active disulfide protein 2
MKIEILGTGCAKCKTLFANVQKAVSEMGISAEIEKVEDYHQIANYGVMTTPALAVNGKVKLAGRVATPEEIKQMLS